MVREGQEGSWNRNRELTRTNQLDIAGRNRSSIQLHQSCGIKTGAEDLQARQIARGGRRWVRAGERGLRNEGVGDAANHARARVLTRNDHLGNMCGLYGSRSPGAAQVDDVDGSASGLNDKGLIGCGIDGDAPKKIQGASRRARSCANEAKSSKARAVQHDLALEFLQQLWGRWVGDAIALTWHRRYWSPIRIAGKRVTLPAHGIRYGHLVDFGIVRNHLVRIGLPGHVGRGQQFRRTCARNDESRALGKKSIGRDRLVERIEQPDL